MKYSFNWLKEISKTKLSPEKVADLLMMHSFEVESIENLSGNLGFNKVVVGEILEINKHPNADRLQLVKLTTDNQQLTTINVVCGASNIKVGDKVPVALVGAKLASGVEIKEAEIRGVKSFGMLCAEDELGLGKDHSGILILKSNAKIGGPINEISGQKDTIIELDVLANRGHDALSHIGIAREIAALSGTKIDSLFQKLNIKKNKASNLSIEIKDKDLCPRYIGAVMTNIKIQESPEWIKNRLLSLGLNPINNVVDATNYVMLELGQPLHAFDISKLTTNNRQQTTIIVRKAKDGEEIKLLDSTVKKLSPDDLVIANDNKALAIAGVMGGEDSGISENTNSIVIESANFNYASIRRTRIRHNLKTDASDRYEKDIDPNLCEKAIARIVEIIESFGGKFEGLADIYPKPVKKWKIKLDTGYVGKLLGDKIPVKKIIKILNSLELKVQGTGKIISVTIPTFRLDLKTQEDLIEEIGRIYGYEKIKSVSPLFPIQPAKISESRQFEKKTKEILAGLGFSEVYNYSFYSQKDAEFAGLNKVDHLELENPMNPNQALMRVSLIPGILNNARENIKKFKELEIFETGRVFLPGKNVLPEEKNILAGAMVFNEDSGKGNFYEAKGCIESVFQKLKIDNYCFKELGENFHSLWHKARTAEIKAGKSENAIGYVGEINPAILKRFQIQKRIMAFEIDMEKLRKSSEEKGEFKSICRFPTSERDISLIADSKTKVGDILQIIQKIGGELVLNTDLFDIFDMEEGKTSFAFHIIFGSDERTLKNSEVEELMEKIIDKLESELNVKIRK